MLVVARRWDQHLVMPAAGLQEVVRANVRHDLGAGQDLRVELLLEPAHRLSPRQQCPSASPAL